ncbi:class I SAM-dependent methyltransferase [Azoarcus sp. PA01]|nr:class I SAM-dependent methyltransferase [Azoarcus sp. PA01]
MPPALKALLAQLAGCVIAATVVRSTPLGGIWPLVAVQALSAAAIGTLLHSARWWLPIHLGFVPLLVLAGRLEVAPGWYLAAFGLLLAVYWTSFRTQVPLYPTNRRTVAAVADLLAPGRRSRLLDLGSGTGSLLRPLARLRPDCSFKGIEAAPGPWLTSRLWTGNPPNVRFERGDFFSSSWSGFDIIYAFLSPVPMAEVWAKARRELHDGLLISNSFPVPGEAPERIIQVPDARATVLYVYRFAPATPQGE